MPTVYVDTEAAEMVEAAILMLETALKARVKRADPNQIISNSLILQANKLAGFRAQLAAPDPPRWAGIAKPLQQKAIRAAFHLAEHDDPKARDEAWELLRGVLNAAANP